eukprot:COSAG06_NODE_42517_length_381_cov_0.546099_1_plen_23_part_01
MAAGSPATHVTVCRRSIKLVGHG